MNNINIKEMENMIMNKTIFILDMSKAHSEYRKLIHTIEINVKHYMTTANIKELLVKYNDNVEYTIKLIKNCDGVCRLIVLNEDGVRMFEPDWGRITGLISKELAGIDGRGWS